MKLKKLEEYSQVDDISKVPIGTHVRYFTINVKTERNNLGLVVF